VFTALASSRPDRPPKYRLRPAAARAFAPARRTRLRNRAPGAPPSAAGAHGAAQLSLQGPPPPRSRSGPPNHWRRLRSAPADLASAPRPRGGHCASRPPKSPVAVARQCRRRA
jgi:hypothetical protein